MSENLISREDAAKDLLSAAAYIAERIESADGQAEAMEAIVPGYLSSGNVDLAAALADLVEDPTTRDRLLISVADRCAEAGDDEYAMQLADAVEDFSLQSQAKERVAVQMANRGDVDAALGLAQGLDHPDEVVTAVAVRLWGQGAEEEALRSLDGMVFALSKCVALQHFAVIAARGGDREKAVELLQSAAEEAAKIDFTEERIRARVDIASNFVDAGRNDSAIGVLDEARADAETLESVLREGFLSNVSVGMYRAGSVDLADRVLDTINDKSALIATLTGFASVHIAKGEHSEALEALTEAHEIIKSQVEKETRDHRVKFNQWATLAARFAACRDFAQGVATALEIPDGDALTSALMQVALVAADMGEEAAKNEAVGHIEDALSRASAHLAFSDLEVRRGDSAKALSEIDAALAILPEIDRPVSRASVLTEAAKRIFALGDEGRGREAGRSALETVSEIVDGSIRAACLANLAAAYIGNGKSASDSESEALASCIARI